MKKQIRQGIFETNSSTTHALVISKCDVRSIEEAKEKITYPGKIVVDPSPIWQIGAKFKTFEERANLFMVSVFSNNCGKGDIFKAIDLFKSLGVEIEFDKNPYDWMNGFVETELSKFIQRFINNEELFVKFLFSNYIVFDSFADDEYGADIDEWLDLLEKEKDKGGLVLMSNRC